MQNLHLNLANEIGALKEEDGEGLITSEFFVGKLGERFELDLRDSVQEFFKLIDVNGVHLSAFDFEGFFQKDIQPVFLHLNHFCQLGLLEPFSACPKQIQSCRKCHRQFLEGRQGLHDLGDPIDMIRGIEKGTRDRIQSDR